MGFSVHNEHGFSLIPVWDIFTTSMSFTDDVRLDFSHKFDAVFIDLERCTPVEDIHPLMGASGSCRYQFPDTADHGFNGESFDYMQLG